MAGIDVNITTTFKGNTDTPNSYTGEKGKVVAVNNNEDGLEFVNAKAQTDDITITYNSSDELTYVGFTGDTNVQSDWNESNNTKDEYIKNKPTSLSDFNNDLDIQDFTDTTNIIPQDISDLTDTTNIIPPHLSAGDGIDIDNSNKINVLVDGVTMDFNNNNELISVFNEREYTSSLSIKFDKPRIYGKLNAMLNGNTLTEDLTGALNVMTQYVFLLKTSSIDDLTVPNTWIKVNDIDYIPMQLNILEITHDNGKVYYKIYNKTTREIFVNFKSYLNYINEESGNSYKDNSGDFNSLKYIKKYKLWLKISGDKKISYSKDLINWTDIDFSTNINTNLIHKVTGVLTNRNDGFYYDETTDELYITIQKSLTGQSGYPPHGTKTYYVSGYLKVKLKYIDDLTKYSLHTFTYSQNEMDSGGGSFIQRYFNTDYIILKNKPYFRTSTSTQLRGYYNPEEYVEPNSSYSTDTLLRNNGLIKTDTNGNPIYYDKVNDQIVEITGPKTNTNGTIMAKFFNQDSNGQYVPTSAKTISNNSGGVYALVGDTYNGQNSVVYSETDDCYYIFTYKHLIKMKSDGSDFDSITLYSNSFAMTNRVHFYVRYYNNVFYTSSGTKVYSSINGIDWVEMSNVGGDGVVGSIFDIFIFDRNKEYIDSDDLLTYENVQSDWDENDINEDSYIKNKPIIGNGEITIKQGSVTKGIFNLNDTANQTITLDRVPPIDEVNDTEIFFDVETIYNTPISPGIGNITADYTGARLGIIQKIYHNDSTEPTFPNGWFLIGGEYKPNELNIIYAEWCDSNNRVEMWIAQEL